MRVWRQARGFAAAWAVTTLVAVVACGGDDPALPAPAESPAEVAPTSSPTPGLDLTPEEQAAVDEALDVFDAYVSTYVQLATEGTDFTEGSHYSELGQYGIAATDGYEAADLDNNQVQGRLGSGVIDWELLEVVQIDLSGDRHPTDQGDPWMRVQICLDETGWTLIDEESAEVVEGPGGRHIANVLLVYQSDEYSELRPEEAWRLGLWEEAEGRSC